MRPVWPRIAANPRTVASGRAAPRSLTIGSSLRMLVYPASSRSTSRTSVTVPDPSCHGYAHDIEFALGETLRLPVPPLAGPRC